MFYDGMPDKLKAYSIFSVAVIVLVFLGVCIYHLYLKDYIAKRVHEYSIPAALVGNQEFTEIVEDWKNLTKINSWTIDYLVAEEKYKFRIRKFLRTGTGKSKFSEIPIVALKLQSSRILIDNHYNSVGNLDWKKAINDSIYITSVRDHIPEDVKKVLLKIGDSYSLLDKEGPEVASQYLMATRIEIENMSRIDK